MRKLSDLIAAAYEALCLVLNSLRNPLLLAIRLYWGWQFAQDGWGSLRISTGSRSSSRAWACPLPGLRLSWSR